MFAFIVKQTSNWMHTVASVVQVLCKCLAVTTREIQSMSQHRAVEPYRSNMSLVFVLDQCWNTAAFARKDMVDSLEFVRVFQSPQGAWSHHWSLPVPTTVSLCRLSVLSPLSLPPSLPPSFLSSSSSPPNPPLSALLQLSTPLVKFKYQKPL